MTDEERIAELEQWAEALERMRINADNLRWLLGEYRRLAQLDAEHADATDCLMQDAARWRFILPRVVSLETFSVFTVNLAIQTVPQIGRECMQAVENATDAAIAAGGGYGWS
jgi:hypothetical protein